MLGLRRAVSRLAPAALRPAWRRTYSQEGEDIVLVNLFGDEFQGIYVDIGAHDPIAWSNTKKLAERGWWGLDIDPMPGLADRFRRHRPKDIFLEAAIDIGVTERLQYWIFDQEPRWNCLSAAEPVALKDGVPVRPSAHRTVPITTIAEALAAANLPRVDLVNIDIEGGEEYILRHWPWERYVPKAICVEIAATPAAEVARLPLTQYLAERGLVFASHLMNSAIYAERTFLAARLPSDPTHSHFDRLNPGGAGGAA